MAFDDPAEYPGIRVGLPVAVKYMIDMKDKTRAAASRRR